MKKEITIIYAFGPKCFEDKYNSNGILLKDEGGWIKIGETSTSINIDEQISSSDIYSHIKGAALKRINQESRTGIPVTSRIYDLFIFPKAVGTDNQIRNLMCNDMYDIENSKNNNKELEEDDIPAGTEFVYGASKNNIKHAIKEYISIIINDATTEDFQFIQFCNKFNSNEILDAKEDCIEENEKIKNIIFRKPILNHDSYLPINSVVELTEGNKDRTRVLTDNGEVVKATYIGNNKFRLYNGIIGTSSALALKFYTKRGSINGNDYWVYENKFLSEYRKY